MVAKVDSCVRQNSEGPVTTKAQQNADNADGAENTKVKSVILLGFLPNA